VVTHRAGKVVAFHKVVIVFQKEVYVGIKLFIHQRVGRLYQVIHLSSGQFSSNGYGCGRGHGLKEIFGQCGNQVYLLLFKIVVLQLSCQGLSDVFNLETEDAEVAVGFLRHFGT
jgi:hypothetical protein